MSLTSEAYVIILYTHSILETAEAMCRKMAVMFMMICFACIAVPKAVKGVKYKYSCHQKLLALFRAKYKNTLK
jgi:hypothetical protein